MNRSSFITVLLVLLCVTQSVFSQGRDTTGKIIGGSIAKEGQFPFIIQLFDKQNNYNFCGGSSLGPYHILTAAHCVDGSTADAIQIWAGSLNIYDPAGYKVNVEKIYPHPDYDSFLIENDVAVIKLVKPFPKSVGLRKIKLATTNNVVDVGTTVTTCGWGNTNQYYTGYYPEDLLYVKTKVVSTNVCAEFYSGYVQGDKMVCAHDPSEGSCYGDSGGPMFTGDGTTATQHGVVSFGSSAGCATAPSVYARVSNYYNWIVSKTAYTAKTACADCATNADWKGLCQEVGGTYKLTATGYQCQDLNIKKTLSFSYTWDNCNNKKVQDLCNQLGRYSCSNEMGKCTAM